MLCLGLLWCQEDILNKSECLFELITETHQLSQFPASMIMFSDSVDNQTNENLVQNTEQWELTLLTLFEIATMTIPNHLGKSKSNMVLWAQSVRALLQDEKMETSPTKGKDYLKEN